MDVIENTELTPTERLNLTRDEIKNQTVAAKRQLKDEKAKLARRKKALADAGPGERESVINEVAALELSVAKIEETIAGLESDYRTVNSSREDETEERILEALGVVAQTWLPQHPSAAYIIDEGAFVFVNDYASDKKKQNVSIKQMLPPAFIEHIANELGIKSWHLPVPRVKDLFNQHKRSYLMSRYSIDDGLWNKQAYLPIKHMEPFFIDRLAARFDGSDYDPCFDWLMYSLSGGKQENQEHLERWVLHKVVNYRKASTTPDIVIVGHVGGNGKGIFQGVTRQMFPATLTGKANAKTLYGNFNDALMAKLVVHFDDQNAKQIPLDVIKQLAGAETMIFEQKGKDQYEAEKTFSACFYNNSLPFELTPAGQEGGVDRRFSFMRTNITFLESIRKHIKERDGVEITPADCKQFAEAIVVNVFRDRNEIAKWFAHLQKKHPEVNPDYTLSCLHGEDYRYFLMQQASAYDVVWRDLIAPQLAAGKFVPVFVVKEIVGAIDGRTPRDNEVRAKIEELAAQNKVDIEIVRTRVTIAPALHNGTAQKTIIKTKGIPLQSTDFDWKLVSTGKYTGSPLTENELVVGADKVVKDTPIDTYEPDIDYDHVALDDLGEQQATERAESIMSRVMARSRLNSGSGKPSDLFSVANAIRANGKGNLNNVDSKLINDVLSGEQMTGKDVAKKSGSTDLFG